MITGGAYQGKKKYAVNYYGISENDMKNGKNCSISDLSNTKCIYNFQYLTKKYSIDDIKKAIFENPDIIIISDIIGEGIIPIEKSERIWRENTGKLCCWIAEKSVSVTRVSCGIGQIIKTTPVVFIRHGKTTGNLEKRYIGRTDEDLCETGKNELMKINYPKCNNIVSSPLKRCIQSAEIIYPDKKIIIDENLRETDFGIFEGKNYSELCKNPDYRNWIDGKSEIPNGEISENFKKRCCNAFYNVMKNAYRKTAFIVHGGVIMAVFEKYGFPKKSFYDYQVSNGRGFVADFDGKYLKIREKI